MFVAKKQAEACTLNLFDPKSIRIAYVENQFQLCRHMSSSAEDGDDLIPINFYASFKNATDHAFLAPCLALAKLAVIIKTGKLGGRSGAAGRTIVFEARAEDEIATVCRFCRRSDFF